MRKGTGARAGVLLALGAALAACGEAEAPPSEPAPENEARAVAEAAEMLEERTPAHTADDGNE